MEVRFQTKEESNQEQRQAFLKLSPIDRFYLFLDLSERMKDFPTKFQPKNSDNYIIKTLLVEKQWKQNIDQFIELCDLYKVEMIMVGGGAVNFHGYQRHSADVDFWLNTDLLNLEKLVIVFQKMGYEIEHFPPAVINKEQNISIKFSPADLNLELITNFYIKKSFEEAYKESEIVEINKQKILRWRVLNLADLIESKRRAARPKDLLDIQQLKEINNIE